MLKLDNVFFFVEKKRLEVEERRKFPLEQKLKQSIVGQQETSKTNIEQHQQSVLSKGFLEREALSELTVITDRQTE